MRAHHASPDGCVRLLAQAVRLPGGPSSSRRAVTQDPNLIARVWCREREDAERLRQALCDDGRPAYAFSEHVTFTRIDDADLTKLAEQLGIRGWHAAHVP